MKIMYFPLQLRLTLFYTLLLGIALWIFGSVVYSQAEQQVYVNLDNTLSSRAASVRLGKDLLSNQNSTNLPFALPSVDGLGSGGVAIEVLDNKLHLMATTTNNSIEGIKTGVTGLGDSPVI